MSDEKALIEANKRLIDVLLLSTGEAFKSVEFRRRQLGALRPKIRTAIDKLWVDPGRGNFHFVMETDAPELKATVLNRDPYYTRTFMKKRKVANPYYGISLRKIH